MFPFILRSFLHPNPDSAHVGVAGLHLEFLISLLLSWKDIILSLIFHNNSCPQFLSPFKKLRKGRKFRHELRGSALYSIKGEEHDGSNFGKNWHKLNLRWIYYENFPVQVQRETFWQFRKQASLEVCLDLTSAQDWMSIPLGPINNLTNWGKWDFHRRKFKLVYPVRTMGSCLIKNQLEREHRNRGSGSVALRYPFYFYFCFILVLVLPMMMMLMILLWVCEGRSGLGRVENGGWSRVPLNEWGGRKEGPFWAQF